MGDPKVKDLIKRLESEGYNVKKRVSYVKKTFNIDQHKLAHANTLRARKNITLQDMFSEALDLWIEKYTK